MALGDWSDVNCVEATYGQTRLGAELRTSLPATFVLYGGTALALRSRDSDEALQLLEPGNRHKLRRPRTRAVN